MAITQIELADHTIGNINDYRLPSTFGTAGQVLKMNNTGTAIIWGSSGGPTGTIIITSLSGATVSINSDSYTYGESETTHEFGPYEYGVYTVTANKSGMYENTISTTIAAETNTCTCNPKLLPDTYTQLTYIQGGNESAYIDTGVILTQDYSIEINFQKVSENGFVGIAGSRDGASSNNISVGVNNNSPLIHTDFNNSDYSAYRAKVDTYTGEIYSVIIDVYASKDERRITFDDTIMAQNTTVCSDTITTPNSCKLFWCSDMGYGSRAVIKFYFTKIWENNTLIKNFIPARQNSDNKIGLYDIVNNEFYENAGSGAFVPGDPVN